MATVEADDDLLVKAQRMLGTDSAGAVNEGLREVIRKRAKRRLLDYFRELDDERQRQLLNSQAHW